MTILQEILAVKKDEVKRLRRRFQLRSFTDFEFFATACLPLADALQNETALAIIAEIKKASPSKGTIRDDFNHLSIAEQYLQNGADAISILTDQTFFQGDIRYLDEVARIKSVPLLRKDFIIDEYQVFEAKAYGADAILLIAEALSAVQIGELTAAAGELGLQTLLELHSASQLKKIDFARNRIIGVNNRNLEDFSVEVQTTVDLAGHLPAGIILISESGISSKAEIEILKSSRVTAILVGEHLMKAANIPAALNELRAWCQHEG